MDNPCAEQFSLKAHPTSQMQNVVNLFAFIANQAHHSRQDNFVSQFNQKWYNGTKMAETTDLNGWLCFYAEQGYAKMDYFTPNPPIRTVDVIRPALVRHGYDGIITSGKYEPTLCLYFPIEIAVHDSVADFTIAYMEEQGDTFLASLLSRKPFWEMFVQQKRLANATPPIIAHNWVEHQTYYYDPSVGKGLVFAASKHMHVAMNALIMAFHYNMRAN